MGFIDVAYGKIDLDNASGTPVDISAQVKSARGAVEGNNQEFYTLGEFFAHVSDSKKRWSIDLVIYATDQAGEAYDLLTSWYIDNDQPGSRTLTISTPDDQAGSTEFSGEVKCASISPLFDIDAAGGKPQEITVRLMGDGALTKATIV